jgi:hypothetical protein
MGQRLTYANVMATIAVFLALGGSAYAASQLGKNSVGSKQLKKNAVTTAKVKNEAITAAKVKKGTLTGTQIKASTLGTVPSANSAVHANTAGDSSTLQGSGPSAFVHGEGSVIVGRRDMSEPTEPLSLIDLPGIGTVTTECKGGVGIEFKNTSGGILDLSQALGGGSTNVSTLKEGAITGFGTGGSTTEEAQFATRGATPIFATVDLIVRAEGSKCVAIAQATLAR